MQNSYNFEELHLLAKIYHHIYYRFLPVFFLLYLRCRNAFLQLPVLFLLMLKLQVQCRFADFYIQFLMKLKNFCLPKYLQHSRLCRLLFPDRFLWKLFSCKQIKKIQFYQGLYSFFRLHPDFLPGNYILFPGWI